MRTLDLPLPIPQLSLTAAIVLFAVFFLGALCEESGWSGYLIDPRITGLVVTAIAALVVIGWGPRTLGGRGAVREACSTRRVLEVDPREAVLARRSGSPRTEITD